LRFCSSQRRIYIFRPQGTDGYLLSSQIHAIAAASSDFRESLHIIRCKSGTISDNAIANLTRAVPSLRDFSFLEAVSLSDAAIISLVKNCPNIERIHISGNARLMGLVTCRGLADVLQNLTIAKQLRYLELWDQHFHFPSVKKLVRVRKKLAIETAISDQVSIRAMLFSSTLGGGPPDGSIHVYLCGIPWRMGTTLYTEALHQRISDLDMERI
jgi:hypothetical protein